MDRDTIKFRMDEVTPEAAIPVTVDSIRKQLMSDPRFGVYRIEEGDLEGNYLVARSSHLIACFTPKRLRELYLSEEFNSDTETVTLEGDIFGRVILTKPQREVLRSSPLAKPGRRDRRKMRKSNLVTSSS